MDVVSGKNVTLFADHLQMASVAHVEASHTDNKRIDARLVF